ncbi:MAG: AAA family ATPase [Porticoccaceae bacterium]|nr:AAA family ATPase [Porticoccaceae bacterium]
MSKDFIQLRKLSFLGPGKESTTLNFETGLNVVCGASDTGKSFLIEAIDFMLGGTKGLRDIPERIGYDRVRLGLRTSNEETFTFERSSEGGGFNLYEGILEDQIQIDSGERLKPKHGHGSTDNLSGWLLSNMELLEKRLRKNAQGDTRSLSFRDLARLVVVDESEIIKNTSPFLTGNPVSKTAEYSALKLLLTGSDDSAIVPAERDEKKIVGTEAKIELLEQMIADLNDEIENKNFDEGELNEQLGRLLSSIDRKREEMTSFQSNLNESFTQRRELLGFKEEIKNRLSEIDEMLERFDLLRKHYLIDIERLKGVEETGSLFVHYEKVPCPLCGSLTDGDHNDDECDGNVEGVVLAAKMEIEKINALILDLEITVGELDLEKEALLPELNDLEERYSAVEGKIREAASPNFQNSQREYSALMEKNNEVILGLDIYIRLEKLELRRDGLSNVGESDVEEIKTAKLSKMTLNGFSKVVENILTEWDFPGSSDVYFDESEKDFVISGKPRGSRGKGLRAITHAAVTIGLMEYCKDNSLPHPGFVVLDSPLLAYYKPEGDDDSLIGSNLKDKFYSYIIENHADSQIIIVENEHPPELYENSINLHIFTKNPQEGRLGLFPVENR